MHKFVLRMLQREMRRRHRRLRARVMNPDCSMVTSDLPKPIWFHPLNGAAADAEAIEFASKEDEAAWVARRWEYHMACKPWIEAPDVIIGTEEDPYLHRWHVVPRNAWPFGAKIGKRFSINIYLHHFLRSDDDRALHDHPWANASWLLDGEYDEVLFDGPIPDDYDKDVRWILDTVGGDPRVIPPTKVEARKAGHLYVRPSGRISHRVQLRREARQFHDMVQCSDTVVCRNCDKSWDYGDQDEAPQFDCFSGKERPVWTLFGTGPKTRSWGFHCKKRWRPWEEFVAFKTGDANKGVSEVGAGCGEDA